MSEHIIGRIKFTWAACAGCAHSRDCNINGCAGGRDDMKLGRKDDIVCCTEYEEADDE